VIDEPISSRAIERLPTLPDDEILVTVVSAPAGFGKTTTVAEWARRRRAAEVWPTVAWLSLEPADDDPAVLRREMDAAVRRVAGSDPAAGPRHGGRVTTVEDLAGDGQPVWLVLDNLDHLRRPETLGALEQLVTWQPRGLRLVLCTRAERVLGLHRLRVSGLLREIGAADLALTKDETAQLALALGVTATRDQMDTLFRLTEGWPVAVRMAATAISDVRDPDTVLANVPGALRTVGDYLENEVLDVLTAEQRQLLRCTSVAERFDADLAGRLTDNANAPELLAELARSDLLVIRAEGLSYRQHPFVRAHLLNVMRQVPQKLHRLHRITARWSAEGDNDLAAAAWHAVRSRNLGLITRMVVRYGPELVLRGELAIVRELIEALPAEPAGTPEVRLVGVLAELVGGDCVAGRRQLPGLADAVAGGTQAVRDLETVARTFLQGFSPASVYELNRLRARIAAMSGWALPSLTLLNSGTASFWLGLPDAERYLRQAESIAVKSRHRVALVHCWSYLGGVAFFRGDLPTAQRLARDAIEQAEKLPDVHGRAFGYCLAGWVAYHLVDHVEARRCVSRALAAFPKAGYPAAELWTMALAAAVDVDTGGDVAAALDRLRGHRKRLSHGNGLPPVVVAHEALLEHDLALRVGRLGWAAEIFRVAVASLGTVGESLLLRVHDRLQHDQVRVAQPLLEQITNQAVRSYFATTIIEAWLLSAVLAARAGDQEQAATQLRAAAEIAEPGRTVRPFRNGGVELRRLILAQVGRSGRLDGFLEELLTLVAQPPGGTLELTEREVELLRELPTLATVEEIAVQLSVSPNTVKTHLRHLYRKLDVRSRRAAVAAGRQYGLI